MYAPRATGLKFITAQKMAAVLLLSMALLALDVRTGPYWSFAVFYYLDIVLAGLWVGPVFGHLVAILTSVARAYGVSRGYPATEPIWVTVWALLTYLVLHNSFCYFVCLLWRIKALLSPDVYPYLKDELPFVRKFVLSPYVHSSWGPIQKINAIAAHHRLIQQLVPSLAIAADRHFDMLVLPMSNGVLRVVIDRPSWMRAEGELAISLFWDVDRIYTAMVLLGGKTECPHLMLGALQGDGRDRKELYKELTKALHGLRPRDFLISLVKMVAAHAGCNEIWGISDRNHRSNHPFTKAAKDLSYDQIWEEHGGVLQPETGFFVMSTRMDRRTATDIPSQKRAMYRRRYDLMDELQAKLALKLSSGRH